MAGRKAVRTVFVGDVHGCAAELDALLGTVGYRQGRDRLLLTGDAFARGPEPLAVWRRIAETGARMVLGNHDDRLLEQLEARLEGDEPGPRKLDHARTIEALMPAAGEVLDWLESVPLYISEERFLLVHAGINPVTGLAATTRDEFLTMRLWPPRQGIEGPRWHEAYAPDDRLLVFGHDAPGGLVVRRRADGTPCLLGLDSGCVYGNQLSAYVLEEGRLAQVDCLQEGGYYER